ncbi:DUF6176 family protein [Cytobacillus purgationiresistens]|uniref:Uncharacterized protein n=1 Tax=Cytobacillus purgationiresistens TaxID=863449 RepID=A0ABU0AIB0_9BACI|nr:DUF6176 family protein [Cytobacillus purgationiresistens]MDQ0269810.1 hypothetical protein [Cytobacillus purgationiresistens]
MKIECTRFKVKEGKSTQVEEWMEFLNQRMDQVLLTLKGEKMYIETIFREVQNEAEYLYWYSIQGEGGIEVTDSNHEIDQLHLQYWDECIDKNYRPIDLEMKVSMIPEKIRREMV